MTDKKISLVTGANTGLGFQTALGLAKAGHHVILACRSPEKAAEAEKRIRRKCKSASLESITLDLIDRDSIRVCAETLSDRHDRLDRLINNAGVMGPPYTMTQNGVELQFDANHLGHFLLTKHLMGLLEQSAEGRIINVASIAGKRPHADIFFENINFEGNYEEGFQFMGLTGMVAYSQSKLANILFTLALKQRLAKAGLSIKALVVHPGASNTDLSRNMPKHIQFLAPVLSRFMNISQPADGAKPTLMAALKKDAQSGDFYGPTGKEERTGPAGPVPYPGGADNQERIDRLWTVSEEMLGVTFDI